MIPKPFHKGVFTNNYETSYAVQVPAIPSICYPHAYQNPFRLRHLKQKIEDEVMLGIEMEILRLEVAKIRVFVTPPIREMSRR